MTWSFLYLTALLIGLVLAAATGLVARLRSHWHPVTIPHPEHHSAFLNLMGQRAAMTLAFFGVVGLVAAQFRGLERQTTFLMALSAAVVSAVAALLVLRSRCPAQPGGETVVVVRDIPAGGYGQVKLCQVGRDVVMAAKSADGGAITAGTQVELLDCQSSVLSVRAIASAGVPA